MAAKKIAGTFRVPSAAKAFHRSFVARLLPLAGFLAMLLAAAEPAFAQPGLEFQPAELSELVQVDEADHAAVALLEIGKALIAEEQWGEAIDKLRQVEESAGAKLFKVEPRRFVPVRQYCQLLVARFPAAGMAAYRERVDPLAKVWYDEGIASRDATRLQQVVDHYFNSSYGDDALLALGEMAIERGEPQKAFALWEQISHKLRPAGGMPMWLAYPDTKLNLADVRARLVLASILAGDLRWAKVELQSLTGNHPRAKGKLGGREVVYVEALGEMIEAAKSWPQLSTIGHDWPTFTGSQTRQHMASKPLTARAQPAIVPLPEQLVATVENSDTVQLVPEDGPDGGILNRPVLVNQTEAKSRPSLSYFPVVSRELLLVNTAAEIFAYRADTGQPAWQGDQQKPGRIFSGDVPRAVPGAPVPGRPVAPMAAPRFTLTVVDRWLFARMGANAIPVARRRGPAPGDSFIVCLDLAAEGRLHWKLTPDDHRWVFEGTPVCDGANVYVAMRYNDGTAMPQTHVACFDLQSGVRRWRQLVCGAQSTQLGVGSNAAHNLLTLAGDSLYVNTNLGAIAALETVDGRVRWLATYSRARPAEIAELQEQPLNPAIYDRGIVFAAPVDFDGILALDAFTGQFLWDSKEVPADAQLIGVSGGKLWIGGKSLCALDARGGKVEYHSAASEHSASNAVGHGRGLLAGGNVYWPVRIGKPDDKEHPPEHQIRIVDALTTKETSPPIQLSSLSPPCDSGNLLATDDSWVIAAPNRLMIFKLPQAETSTDPKD